MGILRTLSRVAGVAALVATFAAPSFAENVYVRFGDGRVLYVPRARSSRYVTNGGVVVNTLPTGYVNQTYTTIDGAPVYYNQDYWYRHRRRWKHDNDYWHRHHERW